MYLTTKLKNDLLISLSQVITFAMFILLLCIVFRMSTIKINDNIFINDLAQNWENKGINKIYISNNKSCGVDEEFFSRIWEGTESACNCKNSIHLGIKSDITKGKCSFTQILLGCKDINSVDKIKANIWKNANLCVKKHANNFYDTITVTDNKCPKKYVICGTDTKNFNLCYPKKFGCPINKIKITNTPLPANEKMLIYNYESLKLNDDWYLHFSNSFVNDSLIVDVKYSEGRVCINPSETNLKPYSKFKKNEVIANNTVHVSNIHSTCVTKVGKFNFDERYKSIDSVSKFKFYTDNKIMQQIEKLPHINSQELISYNSYLYQRSYIHWSPFCRSYDNLTPEAIITDISRLSIIDGYFDVIRFYYIFIFFYFIMHVLLTNFIKIEKKLNSNLEFLTVILLFAFIPMEFLLIYILYTNSSIINKLLSQKCGDYTTNMSLNEIGKNLSDLLINSYQIVLVVIILITFLIVNRIIKK
jgi:hypothetical protein